MQFLHTEGTSIPRPEAPASRPLINEETIGIIEGLVTVYKRAARMSDVPLMEAISEALLVSIRTERASSLVKQYPTLRQQVNEWLETHPWEGQ